MKIVVSGSLIALSLVLASCSSGSGNEARSKAEEAPNPNRVVVSTVKPAHRDIVNEVNLAGSITPYEQVTVYAKTTGYLKSIGVDIGDGVRKGDLLAEIDVPEMTTALEEKRAALLKAEAALQQAEAAVEQSRAELDFQEINYKRLSAIHERDPDVLPEHEVDQARGSYRVTQGKLRMSEADVKVAAAAIGAAKAELATLSTLMDYARIIAPMTGVISERFVDPGALIQAASSSRTQAAPVVLIARLDRVRIFVDVPEPNVPHVQPGTQATIQVQGESFPAKVSRIATVLDPGSRTMRIEIDVRNPDRRLRPGMMARVALQLEKIADAMTVPVSAVQDRGVFVVSEGKAKRVEVRTGVETPQWIQVSGGLSGTEEVIVASAGTLSDGALVQVNQ